MTFRSTEPLSPSPLSSRTPLAGRANFAALAAWLVGSTFMAALALVRWGEDFRGYYAAARVVLANGNPYDYQTLAPVLLATTGGVGNYPYYYAPWLAWFVIPFTWLPFDIARGVWMLLNLGLWILALLLLGKLFDWPQTGWRRWLLYLLATIAFAWITWRCEQVGILLLALLVAALLALREEKWLLAGLWLALLLVKPNITLIPVGAIAIWLVRRRRWQPVASLCAITFGLLATAALITPHWYQSFRAPGFGQGLFDAINGPGQSLGPRLHATLNDWLTMLGAAAFISRAVSVLAFCGGMIMLAVILWRSVSLTQVAAAALLVSFAITPYALHYDYPPLTLVFIWGLALSQHSRRRWTALIGKAIGAFIISVPLWERPVSDSYWIVIGLIGLTVWAWYNADRSQVPASLL